MALFRKKTRPTSRTHDVGRYSFDELVALKNDVDREIQSRQATELEAIKIKIAAIASTFGISVQQLLGFKATERSNKKIKHIVQPKFVDPDNTENTWSGRGKHPRWLKEKIEAGASIDEFAVKSNGAEQ